MTHFDSVNMHIYGSIKIVLIYTAQLQFSTDFNMMPHYE